MKDPEEDETEPKNEGDMKVDDEEDDDDGWDDAEGDWGTDEEEDDGVEDEALKRIQQKSRWLARAKLTRAEAEKAQKEQAKWNNSSTKRWNANSLEDLKKKDDSGIPKFFTSDGVVEILIKQIFTFQDAAKKSRSFPFDVAPIDNDIYHWHVKIRGWPADSQIAADLTCLSSKYDLEEEVVELRIRFDRLLFPFYPPQIRPLFPRLENMMFCSIVCLEDIQLRNWNPVRRLEDVLSSIRKLIIQSGTVDCENPANNPKEGGVPFTETEFQLAKLSLLTQIPFRSNLYSGLKTDNLQAMTLKRTEKKEEPKKKAPSGKAWASGTGYGHRGDEKGWDMNAWQKAQLKKDNEISEILNLVIKDLATSTLTTYNAKLLEDSCLIPFFRKFLDNDSIMDISRHGYLFGQLLQILTAMAKHPSITFLFLDRKSDGGKVKSIWDVLQNLNKKASRTIKLSGSTKGAEDDSTIIQISQKIVACFELVQKAVENAQLAMDEDDREEKKEDIAPAPSKSGGILSSLLGRTKPTDPKKKFDYIKFMKAMCFDEVSAFKKHHYIKGTTHDGATRKVMKRLAAEYSDLESTLPVHLDSSIYFRYLDRNVCFAQMAIVPSDGTPYASGFFIFDVMFPATYPAAPPKVNLQTTGGGSVRFNPNLYNNGKVCLSLLGTWRGKNQGEQWNPSLSTFLQVAVSIQSLIFVPKPYFNEPGYEQKMGTPQAEAVSAKYNKVRQEATVRWAMVDLLKNPPPQWKKMIQSHFYLQQDRTLKNAISWLGDSHTLVKKLRDELSKLPVPTED